MYNKDKIDELFREFIFSKDTIFLAQLIQELSPMIDVVLSKWPQHKRFWPDTKQEIKMRLWRNLQNQNIDRTRQETNPSAYLFFLLRTMCTRILTKVPDMYMLSLDEVMAQQRETAY